MSLRILIADDHGVLRAGLVALLNSEAKMQVVGEAQDGQEAVKLSKSMKPDVVLMDLSMPEMGGIEATRKIKEISPETMVLILTLHEDKEILRESIQAGASGYILKKAVKSELINAIQAVSRGDIYVHSAMTYALLPEQSINRQTRYSPEVTLTQRELEVLEKIVQGYTNNQIAEILNLSVRTIEFHRSNLMGKLNLRSRVELVRYASEHGLVSHLDHGSTEKIRVFPRKDNSQVFPEK